MVTTPGSGTPPLAQPPPPLPQDPSISSTLSNYLNQFSLWCRRGFSAKLNANVALTGVMLQAYDAPAGVAPNVWLLQINQTGVFRTTQIPLGGGTTSQQP